MGIRRQKVIIDQTAAGTSPWVRLDSRYEIDPERTVQIIVSGGDSLLLQATTVDRRGGPTLGSETISNGTFARDVIWTKGAGWSIGSGVASCDGTQVAVTNLAQSPSGLISGETYIVTFTVSNFVAGTITPILGSTVGTARSANGTFTESIVAGASGSLIMQGNAAFDGDIDNVSVILDILASDVTNLITYLADDNDILAGNWTYIRVVKTGAAANGKLQGFV